MEETLFLDAQRCIGCRSCVAACRECETHLGLAMLYIDFVARALTVATVPTLCMHCEDPVAPCAQVCPTQAIMITPDGVVQQALKERCIACRNCVYACPFGIPKVDLIQRLQYKCNMCYDRVVVGKRPMCATVCPSGAISFGRVEQLVERGQGKPVRLFTFGQQQVQTAVYAMLPPSAGVLSVLGEVGFTGSLPRVEAGSEME